MNKKLFFLLCSSISIVYGCNTNIKKDTNMDKFDQLMMETQQEGTGEQPEKGDTIRAHYAGYLASDNSKFDSSYDRGEPLTFRVGVGMVIAGWDQALLQMKVGQKARIKIPAALGYGEHGAGNVIPPHSDLIFDVELVEIVR